MMVFKSQIIEYGFHASTNYLDRNKINVNGLYVVLWCPFLGNSI